MKLTDKRLYQSRSLEDFAFRYYYRDEDNRNRRAANREAIFFAEGFVAPDTNQIWGVDVSGRWDGLVNFKVTADYGAKFEITKAIDGTVPTAYWKENNQSGYDAGLLNTVYAWLYPDNRINCTLQAQAYYELIKDAMLRLPPVVDWEWTKYNGVQANPNYEDLRKWLAAFIRFSGVKPILYTAAGYVALFGTIPADILAMLSGVWVASYGGTKPLLPKGVSKWDMWQFSANGDALLLCPGNQGKRELDLNYMTEEFYARYKMADEPQPEEPEPGEIMATRYEAISVYRMSLRPDHNTSNTPITSIPAQTKIQGNVIWEATGEKWLYATHLTDVPLAVPGWVAIMSASRVYCSLVDNQPAPPAELPNRIGLVLREGDAIKWYVAE